MTHDELLKKYPILEFFQFAHLPTNLQAISEPFCVMAHQLAANPTKRPAEMAAALRKLLEAKDCAVRALMS